MPIRHRIAPLTGEGCPPPVLCGIRRDFSRLSLCDGQVAYVLLTRAPVAGRSKQAYFPAAPRLACVKPVASVHPEPGSNSPLLLSFVLFFLVLIDRHESRKETDRLPHPTETNRQSLGEHSPRPERIRSHRSLQPGISARQRN